MELLAPSRWACIDFISDLHLQASDALTFRAWSDYLQKTTADAVFILGDLFEVWVGDDVLTRQDGFERQCADVLRAASQRVDLYIMCGNRDFLMGNALMQSCNSTLLDDPTVLTYADQRWLLTHGDALCLDDTPYMHFRSVVRSPQWQRDFLDKPLSERLEQARAMRKQSEDRKQSVTVYADVDTPAANALLDSVQAQHMIHGHTHRPAKLRLDAGRERLVLSDWDLTARPARAQVLRLRQAHRADHQPTYTVERLPPAMAMATPRSAD